MAHRSDEEKLEGISTGYVTVSEIPEVPITKQHMRLQARLLKAMRSSVVAEEGQRARTIERPKTATALAEEYNALIKARDSGLVSEEMFWKLKEVMFR